jgi:hypothetical protein
MHPEIPETEKPVQGFFYAGAAARSRDVFTGQNAK